MNISLPDDLRTNVDAQAAAKDYGNNSEFFSDLIRHDRDRQGLRQQVLDGLDSEPGSPANNAYFDSLRASVERATG